MIDDNPVNDILQSQGQRCIIKPLKLFPRFTMKEVSIVLLGVGQRGGLYGECAKKKQDTGENYGHLR